MTTIILIIGCLSAISVEFDGAPRVSLDESGKVLLKLVSGERVRTAIEIVAYPANCTGISINSRRSFTLQFKIGKVLFIKSVVAF